MSNQPTQPSGDIRPDARQDARTAAQAQLFAEILTRLDSQNAPVRKTAARGATGQDEDTIDIIELIYYLLTKVPIIALAALVCAVLAGLYARTGISVYTATSKLYLIGNTGSSIIADLQIGAYLTMDYQEVFRTWEVHQMVNDALGTTYTYSQMQSMLTVENPENTSVLYITVVNPDPQLAADMANAYAEAAKRFITQIMGTDEPSTFSVALVPSVGIGASVTSSVLKGILLGTMLAGGVFVLIFLLDKRPKAPDDILRYANIPTLAVIPDSPNLLAEKQRGKRRGSAS